MHQFDADLQGRPQLNFDILSLVCDSLTAIPDVLSFALTCSALTENAFRRRLRMSPINLKDEESIDSFSKFIFADEAARGPNIYGLTLPDPYNYGFGTSDPRFQTINNRLVLILQAAVHLQYIYFLSAVDLDTVLTAAANMTSLRELCLPFERNSPWKLLSTFRSPLRSLRIHVGVVYDEGITTRLFHDHLANFALSLEVLHLESSVFNIPPSLVTTQFTTVRSLTIWNIFDVNQFTVEVLLQLFPNLDNTLALYNFETTHGEDVYPHWRELSVEAQKNHAWRRLDHVYGDAELVFLMALQCPIRRMDVRVSQHQIKRYLAPALRHNYPQHLHCVVLFNDGLGELDELFPSEGAEKLTHLVMFADSNIGWNEVEPTEVPWSQFKDKLIASMRHLRLTHLRLVFHSHVLKPEHDSEEDSMYIASETDLHQAAIEFARATPTLRYIFLTTCGDKRTLSPHRTPSGSLRINVSRWLASKAWRIAHTGRNEHHPAPEPSNTEASGDSEAWCTELSGGVAERIMDREELHLPQDEEHTLRTCGDSAT